MFRDRDKQATITVLRKSYGLEVIKLSKAAQYLLQNNYLSFADIDKIYYAFKQNKHSTKIFLRSCMELLQKDHIQYLLKEQYMNASEVIAYYKTFHLQKEKTAIILDNCFKIVMGKHIQTLLNKGYLSVHDIIYEYIQSIRLPQYNNASQCIKALTERYHLYKRLLDETKIEFLISDGYLQLCDLFRHFKHTGENETHTALLLNKYADLVKSNTSIFLLKNHYITRKKIKKYYYTVFHCDAEKMLTRLKKVEAVLKMNEMQFFLDKNYFTKRGIRVYVLTEISSVSNDNSDIEELSKYLQGLKTILQDDITKLLLDECYIQFDNIEDAYYYKLDHGSTIGESVTKLQNTYNDYSKILDFPAIIKLLEKQYLTFDIIKNIYHVECKNNFNRTIAFIEKKYTDCLNITVENEGDSIEKQCINKP